MAAVGKEAVLHCQALRLGSDGTSVESDKTAFIHRQRCFAAFECADLGGRVIIAMPFASLESDMACSVPSLDFQGGIEKLAVADLDLDVRAEGAQGRAVAEQEGDVFCGPGKIDLQIGVEHVETVF